MNYPSRIKYRIAVFAWIISFLAFLSLNTAYANTHTHQHHSHHHSAHANKHMHLAHAQKKHYKKQHTYQSSVEGSSRYSDILIDTSNGKILHATNPNSLRHPASLTKMMTLYLTFKAIQSGKLSMNQPLTVSAKAANQEPTKLGLHAGEIISVKDAIFGLVTQSANDAAVTLAEAINGDEASFSQSMNQQAAALGMNNTHFANASGLPNPSQVTTAIDMATLGIALIHNFPQFYSFFSQTNFNFAGIHFHNHNHLMSRYPGMDGIKTGYIQSSGFNLVASAKRGKTRLIGVIFGGTSPTSRDQQMAVLLNNGFENTGNNNPSQSYQNSARLIEVRNNIY